MWWFAWKWIVQVFAELSLLESLQNLFGGCDRNLLFRKVLWTDQIGLKMALKGWNSVFEPENMHFLIKRGGLGTPLAEIFLPKINWRKKEVPLVLQLVAGAKECLFHWHWAIETGVNVMGIKRWNKERKAEIGTQQGYHHTYSPHVQFCQYNLTDGEFQPNIWISNFLGWKNSYPSLTWL